MDFTRFEQEENLTEKTRIILHRKKQTNYYIEQRIVMHNTIWSYYKLLFE